MKKILVVDDSALMRRIMFDIINADGNLRAENYATNGLEALELLSSGEKFDAIVLDINMPKMNGLDFLRELKARRMQEKVLIVSTLAKEGAIETIQALELGAFDFVTKPDSLAEAKGPGFGARLVEMLYVATGMPPAPLQDAGVQAGSGGRLGTAGVRTAAKPGIGKPAFGRDTAAPAPKSDTKTARSAGTAIPHSKKPVGSGTKKLVALACSTGGPKALQYVIPFLPANLDAPILLVQHMPAGFTASLAKRLNELSKIEVKEAAHGEALQKGIVYIAKGGSQMRLIEKGKNEHTLSVTVEEARNGLKPCADIMYESLMKSSFDEITCVVMTGMGADGTKGILQLEQTNKIYVIAQDEPSSTVYGMPKAVAESGAVDQVVDLKKIADAIAEHVGVR